MAWDNTVFSCGSILAYGWHECYYALHCFAGHNHFTMLGNNYTDWCCIRKKNDYCLVSAAPVYGFLVMGLIRIIRGSPLEELFFFSFADLEWIEICLCLIMYPNSNYFS